MELYAVRAQTIAELPEPLLRRWMPQRFARAEKCLRPQERLHRLGTGALLCAVLHAEEGMLRYGENGKPYIPGGPEFSLSHGGGFAVLAVDGDPIGADIEPVDAARLRLAPSLFTPEERLWMRRGDEAERFFVLWTLKESAVKATGSGLRGPVREIDVLPAGSGYAHSRGGAQWYGGWTLLENCVLAVTAAHPFQMPPVREMSKNCLQMLLERPAEHLHSVP